MLAQVSKEANAFVTMLFALIRNLLKYLEVKGKPRKLAKISEIERTFPVLVTLDQICVSKCHNK